MKKRDFIIQDLLSKIYQNKFESGKLPTQRELSKIYSVSRFTIQQAISNLSEMGIVNVVQGAGIYIHEKWVKNPLIFNSLTRTPYDRIQSKMLSLEKRIATAEEQKIFQIEDNEKVWNFKRIRIVNYKIEQLEISTLPVKLFPDISKDVVEGSIQKYIEKKGFTISHYITRYIPSVLTTENAKILQCKRGTPAMQIINRAILKDGRVFEYSNIIAIDYDVTYIRPFDRRNHKFRTE
jgi:GntR family mannosyl-D-glycerate transport/metabolism transcriptional repressor